MGLFSRDDGFRRRNWIHAGAQSLGTDGEKPGSGID